LEINELVELFCKRLSNVAASWERNSHNSPTPDAVVEILAKDLAYRRFVIIRYN
jgi:hypothetical protein